MKYLVINARKYIQDQYVNGKRQNKKVIERYSMFHFDYENTIFSICLSNFIYTFHEIPIKIQGNNFLAIGKFILKIKVKTKRKQKEANKILKKKQIEEY